MIQYFFNRLSEHPALWTTLRRVVENGYGSLRAAIDEELKPFNGAPDRRFLDLGCGTGEFASCFPASQYVGVDLSRGYTRYAVQRHPAPYAVMNVQALGFANHSFDAALILGVLHHLPDEQVREAIVNLWHALRPGAPVLVIEDIPAPNRWNLPGRLMHWLDRGSHIRRDEDYRALFTPQFAITRSYTCRSGICDYGIYVLEHQAAIELRHDIIALSPSQLQRRT